MAERRIARLGPLEVAVMDWLWAESESLGVVAVHAAVGAPRGLARNTIHSTLERLVRKGLVGRSRQGRAHLYRAVGSRRAWIAATFDALVEELGDAPESEVLAGFVEFAARTEGATLEILHGLVEARLAQRRREEDA